MTNPISSLTKIDALLYKACSVGLPNKTNIKNVFRNLEEIVGKRHKLLISDLTFDFSTSEVLEQIKEKLRILDPKEFTKLTGMIGEIQNKERKIASCCHKYGIALEEFKQFMEKAKVDTPLQIAIVQNKSQFVHALAELGFNVNQPDTHGRTPLMLAIRYDAKPEIVEILKNYGADINFADNNNMTPLGLALFKSKKEIFEKIIQGVDLNKSNNQGWTPLMLAIRYEANQEIIEALLKGGASLNYRDWDGMSPISFAIKKGNLHIIETLLDYGKYCDNEDDQGWTPLSLAIQYNAKPEIFETLKKRGANFNYVNEEGETPLIRAIVLENPEVIQMLIKLGAKVDGKENASSTPLMKAIQVNARTEIFEILKSHQADFNLSNKFGITPLGLAIVKGNSETVKILIESGADVNQKYKVEKEAEVTPLYAALALQKMDIASLLEDYGADRFLAQEIIDKIFLAHVFGMEGFSSVVKNGINYRFSREGMESEIVLKQLCKYLRDFFEINGKTIQLKKEDQDCIEKVLSNSYPLMSDSNVILSQAQTGEPIAILAGVNGHAISMVFFKGQLSICNRGDGRTKNSVEYYSLPDRIDKNLIKNLTTVFSCSFEFNNFIKSLNLTHLGGFSQKDQKVGNCTLASSKGIFEILCCLMTNHENGRKIYKQFTSFLREHAFRNFIACYNPKDDELLDAIRKKIRLKKGVQGLIDPQG